MYGSLFNFADSVFSDSAHPNNLFHGLEQMQRQLRERSIVTNNQTANHLMNRTVARGTFPAINLGSTDDSIEVFAFVPGVDTDSIDIQIDKNLLTISGERKLELNPGDKETTVYAQERFSGKFKRVVTLPEDADVNNIDASCKEGVLTISIQRQEAALPKRIDIH